MVVFTLRVVGVIPDVALLLLLLDRASRFSQFLGLFLLTEVRVPPIADLPVVPGLLQGQVVAPLGQLLAEQVFMIFMLEYINGVALLFEIVQIVAGFLILMHNHFTVFILLEHSHVVRDTVESLLTHPGDPWSRLEHFHDLVLKALLHDMPHEHHVLSAAHEDVAVVASHDPVMLLAGPSVRDL